MLTIAALYVAAIGVFATRWWSVVRTGGFLDDLGPEVSGARAALFAVVAVFALAAGVLGALGLRGRVARRRFVMRVRAGAIRGWTVAWRAGRRDLGLPHLWPGADEGAKILSGPGGEVAVVP